MTDSFLEELAQNKLLSRDLSISNLGSFFAGAQVYGTLFTGNE